MTYSEQRYGDERFPSRTNVLTAGSYCSAVRSKDPRFPARPRTMGGTKEVMAHLSQARLVRGETALIISDGFSMLALIALLGLGAKSPLAV